VWIIIACKLFYTNSQNILSPSSFFTDKDTVFCVNNALETKNSGNVEKLTFEKIAIDSVLQYSLAQNNWQRCYFSQSNDSSIAKLLIEGKQDFTLDEFKKIAQLFSFDTSMLVLNEIITQNTCFMLAKRNYIAFSISTIELDKLSSSLDFNKNDLLASYTIQHANERKDFYKTAHSDNEYIVSSSKKTLRCVNDIDFYAVMPRLTNGFLFLEKNFLLRKFPEWKEQKILEVFSNGVIFSQFEGNPVYYFDINEKFTPSEIKDLFALISINTNNTIFPLNTTLPGMKNTYATDLENILIVSNNEKTLEKIRLNYQLGDLFIQTETYKNNVENQPKQVAARWWNYEKVNEIQLPKSSLGALTYIPKCSLQFIVLNHKKEVKKENQHKRFSIEWTCSVGNASDIKTSQGIIAVWDAVANHLSLVSSDAHLLQKIELERKFLSLFALRDGFVLLGKTNFMWIPVSQIQKIAQYDFKEPLQNIAADFTWEGSQKLAFISENNLLCFDVKTEKIEKYTLQRKNEIANNLFVYNQSGNLAFSITNEKETILLNTKSKKIEHVKRKGDIVAVEKFGMNVYYLIKNGKGFNIQENDTKIEPLSIPNDYVYFGAQNTPNITCFIFRKNEQFVIYDTQTKALHHFKAPINTVEKIAIVHTESGKNSAFFLDGVQNNVYIQNENNAMDNSIHFEGSHFVYSKSIKQFITYLDGNLICYTFD
jgi:hypothetical protein